VREDWTAADAPHTAEFSGVELSDVFVFLFINPHINWTAIHSYLNLHRHSPFCLPAFAVQRSAILQRLGCSERFSYSLSQQAAAQSTRIAARN
jgi:hypothetical protein